jgi:type IV secretory pathway VirB10-like protein
MPAAAALPGVNPAGSPGVSSPADNLAFLNGNVDRQTVSPDRVEAPASADILQAGSVIAAALLTGLSSDLPGQITAQVTENV